MRTFTSSCAVAVAISTIPAVPGRAADAAEQAPRAVLEEVVVTAQKREERLQDVPISVQVVDSERLREANNNTLEALTQTTPGVHVSTDAGANKLFIRGIGSGGNRAFDQSVATFVDDVYRGRSRMSAATFLDLDRVEILKGPQSTFFGNSAIAGALNIVSAKPTDYLTGWARALYGRFGEYALESAVSGPVSDTLGLRVAATFNGVDDGWVHNINTGDSAPRIKNRAGRATLAFHPTEDLDVVFKIEGGTHDTLGTNYDQPLQWSNCPPPAPIPPTFNGFCSLAIAQGVPIGLEGNAFSDLPGQFNSFSNLENVLSVSYVAGPRTFTSVTSYFNYDYDGAFDFGHLPTNFFATGKSPETYHQFSQEFRVASASGEQWEYLAGVYFQSDQLDAGPIEVTLPIFNGFLATIPGLEPYLPLDNAFRFKQDEKIYSAFASMSWQATDRLKLSGGLRASRVTKDSSGSVHKGQGTQLYGGFVQWPAQLEPYGAIFGGPAGDSPRMGRTDDALMPSARIQYQLSDDAMVYFRYDRGFKAGGINGESPLGPPTRVQFGPERVNAYEVGIKSEWFDHRFLLNVDVFRMDYTDLQVGVNIFDPAVNAFVGEIRNAGTSVSQGVELEMQWVSASGFKLAANVAYLDAHYVRYENATPMLLQVYCGQLDAAQFAATTQCSQFSYPVSAVASYSGLRTPYSPRWSGSVVASYATSLTRALNFIAEVSPYASSSYNTNDKYLLGTDSYVRLDARMALETADGRWTFEVIGKNLTDEVIVSVPTAFGYLTAKEPPRSVAAQVRFHW